MKNNKTFLWTQCGLAVLFCAVGSLSVVRARAQENKVSIPAAQLVKAIHAASSAKAGNIAEVEVERGQNGVTVDVEVVGTDGKTYDVSVNAATSKVLSVTVDKEDGDEGKEEKEGETNDKD